MVRHDVGHASSQLLRNAPTGRHGYCVAISPDGRFVATTSGVYDTTTNTTAFITPDDWTSIYSAAFTSDGKLLIAVTDHGDMLVVDTSNWQLLERQKWSDSPLVSLSISPDGNHVVTGEDAKAVRLGTIRPLRVLGVLGQHTARVKAVAFSPDGKYVASAGDDKMVALWDVSRRKLVTTIGTHTSPIYALAFSPDGQQLITGEHDRSVRRYTRRRTLWGSIL
jgi:WD40 repeat protein